MAPPMICCDSGTLCVVVPWLVPDVWQPSAASGVSRLSKGARFCSGRLCAALAVTSWACAGLKSRPGIWPGEVCACHHFPDLTGYSLAELLPPRQDAAIRRPRMPA